MGRFLAIVLALVAIALLVNWYQSQDESAETNVPALVVPDKEDLEAAPVPLIKDVPESTTTSPAEIAKESATEEPATEEAAVKP